MALDYLKFVEEHESYNNFNVFEKVLMAAQRAKAIYEVETEVEEEDEQGKRKVRKRSFAHKPTYRAILEINEGKVNLCYRTEEELKQAQAVVASPEPEEAPVASETVVAE